MLIQYIFVAQLSTFGNKCGRIATPIYDARSQDIKAQDIRVQDVRAQDINLQSAQTFSCLGNNYVIKETNFINKYIFYLIFET